MRIPCIFPVDQGTRSQRRVRDRLPAPPFSLQLQKLRALIREQPKKFPRFRRVLRGRLQCSRTRDAGSGAQRCHGWRFSLLPSSAVRIRVAPPCELAQGDSKRSGSQSSDFGDSAAGARAGDKFPRPREMPCPHRRELDNARERAAAVDFLYGRLRRFGRIGAGGWPRGTRAGLGLPSWWSRTPVPRGAP